MWGCGCARDVWGADGSPCLQTTFHTTWIRVLQEEGVSVHYSCMYHTLTHTHECVCMQVDLYTYCVCTCVFVYSFSPTVCQEVC